MAVGLLSIHILCMTFVQLLVQLSIALTVVPKAIYSSPHADATCTIMSDDTVRCWGHNAMGGLGINSTEHNVTTAYTPTWLPLPAKRVALSQEAICFLMSDNNTRCAGSNYWAELGILSSVYSVGESSLNAMQTNVQIPLHHDICGMRHSFCALLVNPPAIRCWGDNMYGQLGINSTAATRTITTDVYLAGPPLSIACGYYHACAIYSNSGTPTVKCWGEGQAGQLGTMNGTDVYDDPSHPGSDVALPSLPIRIALGCSHSCALNGSGSILCWGDNTHGQCGTLDTAINPGLNGPIFTDVQFADFARATKVCGGAFYTCALLSDGYIRCWGQNDKGVLGIGHGDENLIIGNSNNPIVRNVLLNAAATDIACGWAHVCALVTDKVFCWGRNNEGQLGIRTRTDFEPQPTIAVLFEPPNSTSDSTTTESSPFSEGPSSATTVSTAVSSTKTGESTVTSAQSSSTRSSFSTTAQDTTTFVATHKTTTSSSSYAAVSTTQSATSDSSTSSIMQSTSGNSSPAISGSVSTPPTLASTSDKASAKTEGDQTEMNIKTIGIAVAASVAVLVIVVAVAILISRKVAKHTSNITAIKKENEVLREVVRVQQEARQQDDDALFQDDAGDFFDDFTE